MQEKVYLMKKVWRDAAIINHLGFLQHRPAGWAYQIYYKHRWHFTNYSRAEEMLKYGEARLLPAVDVRG